jgi:hypothetical protein
MSGIGGNFIKILLVAALVTRVGFSYGAAANIYDDKNMVTVRSGDQIIGYYASAEDRFSCIFFFFTKSKYKPRKSQDNYSIVDIETFIFDIDSGNYDYAHRVRGFDISGVLYLHENNFILKTARPQAGCMGSAGMFRNSPGERGVIQYNLVNQIPAIGIRLVDKKTYLYRKGDLRERVGYLVQGDIILLVKENLGSSYVRYINPNADSDRISAGWVDSNNLVDPFPSEIK